MGRPLERRALLGAADVALPAVGSFVIGDELLEVLAASVLLLLPLRYRQRFSAIGNVRRKQFLRRHECAVIREAFVVFRVAEAVRVRRKLDVGLALQRLGNVVEDLAALLVVDIGTFGTVVLVAETVLGRVRQRVAFEIDG